MSVNEILRSDIERDIDDLTNGGVIGRARDLSAASGQHFDARREPQYFTGRLDASLVLVHLNPKSDDDSDPPMPLTGPATIDAYVDRFTRFGERHYGEDSPRTHTSPFDLKQVRFLRPFGVMDLVEESSPEGRYENLRQVIDDKLQLELVPYGSKSFATAPFTRDSRLLAHDFERILSIIAEAPRTHVLFCARVFGKLLAPYLEEPIREERFHLPLVDGSGLDRAASAFAPLRLRLGTLRVQAGWAPSYARQGINAVAYGNEVAARMRVN